MASHDKTLRAIFEKPTRADIAWREIEALFRHLGAEVVEGKGSRVRITLNGVPSVFHRPHPNKEASKPTVRSVRQFLANTGVRHDA
jgi:HicA toxin of bacterial toxin-antitoxin,